MKYQDVLKTIERRTGISQVKVKDVVEELVRIIYIELGEEGTVQIDRLGVFKTYSRKARIGKNGYVPSKLSPMFWPSKVLRGHLENKEK